MQFPAQQGTIVIEVQFCLIAYKQFHYDLPLLHLKI